MSDALFLPTLARKASIGDLRKSLLCQESFDTWKFYAPRQTAGMRSVHIEPSADNSSLVRALQPPTQSKRDGEGGQLLTDSPQDGSILALHVPVSVPAGPEPDCAPPRLVQDRVAPNASPHLSSEAHDCHRTLLEARRRHGRWQEPRLLPPCWRSSGQGRKRPRPLQVRMRYPPLHPYPPWIRPPPPYPVWRPPAGTLIQVPWTPILAKASLEHLQKLPPPETRRPQSHSLPGMH